MKPGHFLAFSLFALASHLKAAEILTVRLPEGALQPRTASAAEGASHVVFLQGDPQAADVKLATLSSDGKLGESIPVNNSRNAQAIAMGTVRGPSIAMGAQGMSHILWHGKSGSAANGKGSALWYARVPASGSAMEPKDMMGGTFALDGGAAIAADATGHVWIVWHALPAGKEGTGESERRLFIRNSADNGLTFSDPWPVKGEDKGICGCCGLTASLTEDGSLYILYRTAEHTSQRGARVIRLPANATAATKAELLQKDTWAMPGCPMTTAAMLPNQKNLITSWVTEYKSKFLGWTAPALPAGGKPQNHPRMARNSAGETLVLWTEGSGWGKGGELVAQVFPQVGEPPAPAQRHPLPTWSYGACAALPNGNFVVLY